MFLGLRTVIYATPDLEKAKAWYSEVLGMDPYFSESYYVGFNVGGFELGLNPDPGEDAKGMGGVVPYWGVPDASAEYDRILGLGAEPVSPVQDVGEGIKVAILKDPFGNALGIIENPNFKFER